MLPQLLISLIIGILVGGLEHLVDFSIQLGMSSSQLTKSIICQRGRAKNHQAPISWFEQSPSPDENCQYNKNSWFNPMEITLEITMKSIDIIDNRYVYVYIYVYIYIYKCIYELIYT